MDGSMSGGDGERAVVDGERAIDGSMGGRAVEGSIERTFECAVSPLSPLEGRLSNETITRISRIKLRFFGII